MSEYRLIAQWIMHMLNNLNSLPVYNSELVVFHFLDQALSWQFKADKECVVRDVQNAHERTTRRCLQMPSHIQEQDM